MLELGELREAMAQNCWKMAEDMAHKMKHEIKPFYIVFFAKPDANIAGEGIKGIRQCFKAYYDRPPKMLGILVWYVNNPMGMFEFMPDLSSPPDVPLQDSELSTCRADSFGSVMEKGKNLNVLVS
jgi:hypothetical protein